MGIGVNWVYIGLWDDVYLVILDDFKDVIYDKGGKNVVVIML